jgi:hypothetical protein
VSANVEWGVPFTIQSSYGDLTLNDTTNPLGYFVLVESGCAMGRDLRAVSDPIPQGDGQVHHRRFADGYQVRLTIELWENPNQAACAEVARLMVQELMLHLNDMLNDPGRVLWTPTGLGDQRILDEARVVILQRPTVSDGAIRFDVTFDSPFPYVLDFAQVTEALADGVPENLTNNGNVEMFPVVKVYGPTSFFTLENTTVGQTFTYDATQPGASSIAGGDYLELDFFKNSAFLNGTGARRFAGIEVESSDFWPLVPGVNAVEITGATADVLFNHTYA